MTEIDVKATMKKKLDIEMPAYHILGAYNLKMACSGIGMEPRVGVMLTCNYGPAPPEGISLSEVLSESGVINALNEASGTQ